MINFKKNTVILEDGTKLKPCTSEELKEYYAQGCQILAHVRKEMKTLFPTKNHILVGCEIPLEIPLTDNIVFTGFIDTIIQNTKTGEYFIYDYKTSSRGWFYEKKDPLKLQQLLLYKKYYAKQLNIDESLIFVSFIILKRLINEQSEWATARNRVNVFSPTQGKTSTKKAAKELQDFHETVFDVDGNVKLDNLKATPSAKACKYCAFKDKPDLCPDSFYK